MFYPWNCYFVWLTIMFMLFFYHFKGHLIFRTHHLLFHFAWNICHIPKFPDVTNLPKLTIYWAKISSGVLILCQFVVVLFGFAIQIHHSGVSLAIISWPGFPLMSFKEKWKSEKSTPINISNLLLLSFCRKSTPLRWSQFLLIAFQLNHQ